MIDSTLVVIAILSLAMAVSLSVVVWRLLREERRRSDARVAALAEMATRTETATGRDAVVIGPATVKPAAAPPVSAPSAPQPVRAAARRQAPIDLPLRDPVAPSTSVAPPMFREAEQSSPWSRRLVVIGGLGLAAAAAVFIALTASAQRAAPAAPSARAATAAAAAGSKSGIPGRLELLSLRDNRQPGSLTITGLVQNPHDAAPLSRVSVTAFAFDQSGAFLASGRAPLDVTSLAPGEESPFVVSVPVSDTVARYRIGFRGDDGRVIAHIDKRQSGTVARR